MIRDAVCGQDLSGELYVFHRDYKGDTYSFCSMGCRRTFEEAPNRYAHSVLVRTFKHFVAFLRSPGRDSGGKCC